MNKIIAIAVFIALIAYIGYSEITKADLLGPDVKTTHLYAGPAVTAIDSRTELGALVGVRHYWHPFDLVAEANLREKSSINLMLAKQFGDNIVLGGVSFQDGGKNTGLVMGIDHKRLKLRISTFETSTSVTTYGAPVAFRWCRDECDESPPPPVTTVGSKGHSAITVSWSYPL